MKNRIIPYKELHRCFVVIDDAGTCREASDLSHADGVLFDCPNCLRHTILCRKRQETDDRASVGVWHLDGTGPENLTLRGEDGRNSIALPDGCEAYFSIQNGQAMDMKNRDSVLWPVLAFFLLALLLLALG